jgi:tetratricopeptide (TPR) repeat protein
MQRFLAVMALLCGATRAQTVLVLPFFNHSKSSSLDWIGESISESVHDALASEGLIVLDRADRLEAYRRLSLRPGAELTHASMIKAGDALDAARIVYGDFDLLPPGAGAPQSRGTLRINARIIDLKETRQGPAFSQLDAIEDLASLETRLSWQALSQIAPQKATDERQFIKARPPVRLDAVESYIRGLLAASAEQRHRLFTQSARLDEHYSPPCFQLGRIAWEQKDYKTAAPWLARVSRPDPHFLEAQFFLGLCDHHLGDFAAAQKAFALVAESVPLNEAWNNLGAAQARNKDIPGAIASFRKALEGDDADPDYHFNLGYILWKSGNFDAAIESFRAVLARNAADAEATSLLGFALKHEGPHAGDPRTEGRERLKTNYDEAAYRQLQAELQK